MFVAKNRCEWLLKDRPRVCARPCVEIYCRFHNAQLKKGKTPPPACIICGVRGTRSTMQICMACDNPYDRIKRWRMKKAQLEK